jgi:hypothetical protein
LRSVNDEAYLVAAYNLIAAALAVRGPRQPAMQERNAEATNAIRRVRARLTIMHRFKQLDSLQRVIQENSDQKAAKNVQQDGSIIQRPDDPAHDDSSSKASVVTTTLARFGCNVRRKVVSTLRKCRGASVKAPPSFTWE